MITGGSGEYAEGVRAEEGRNEREATNDIDGDGVGEIRDCGQQIKQREILEDLHTLEN